MLEKLGKGKGNLSRKAKINVSTETGKYLTTLSPVVKSIQEDIEYYWQSW